MNLARTRTAILLAVTLGSPWSFTPVALAQYFDYSASSGLTATTSQATADWGSNYWQASYVTDATPPALWVDGSSAYFSTGGINNLNVAGQISVAGIFQEGAGTQTNIGGTGLLNLLNGAGNAIHNESGANLRFLSGLVLNLGAGANEHNFDVQSGSITTDGIIRGSASTGLVKNGVGTLYLNGRNTYTGLTKLYGGTTVAGSTSAFGSSVLSIDGGTLQYGAGIVTDYARLGPIAVGLGDAVIDTNGNNVTLTRGAFSGTGGSTVTKTGDGRLTWSAVIGTDTTFGGSVIVDKGILAFVATGTASPPVSPGVATDTFNVNYKLPAGGIVVKEGATLDISGLPGLSTRNTAVAESISIEGRGVGGVGALVKSTTATWNPGLARMTLTDHATFQLFGERFDIDGVNANASGFSLTKTGTGAFMMDSNFSNLGNVYVKQGIISFHGDTSLGYYNNPSFGDTLVLNSAVTLSNYARGDGIKKITLNGALMQRTGEVGTVQAAGKVLTAYEGLNLKSGNSRINHVGTTATATHLTQQVFALGVINRSVGATLDITNTATLTSINAQANNVLATTSTTNTAGIIGGYLIYGGLPLSTTTPAPPIATPTWAVSADTGTNIAITGLAEGAYDVSTAPSGWTAASNVSLAGPPSANVSTNAVANSLRLTAASATTISNGASLTINSGGILVTGIGATSINGVGTGTLRGAAGKDLIIHQLSTTQSMTIGAIISDNTTATALTKSGGGTLVLSGMNTYTGHTYINGPAGGATATPYDYMSGASLRTNSYLEVSTLTATGNDNLGSNSNQLFLNDGVLRYTNAATDGTLSRQVNLLSGGGFFDVTTAARTLEITGKITGEVLAADEGWYFGQGNLVKQGTGTLVISNATNDYTGGTVVHAGTLRMGVNGKLGDSRGYLYVNSANTVFDLNGTSQTVGLLSGNSATSYIQNGGTGNSILTVGNGDSTSGADSATGYGLGNGFMGVIRNNTGSGTGVVSLTKVGVGIQILSGASTYTGTTSINAGNLQIGSGTAAGAHATARTGTGLHTVLSGAILSGNGTVGGTTVVNTGGVISVGNFGQTAAQALSFNGGLTNNGVIGLDIWSHAAGATTADSLKFNTDSAVVLGRVAVNLSIGVGTGASTWAANESIKLVDWGANSIFNRTVDTSLLDISTLGLTSAGTYWDTSRLAIDGTIAVLADAFTWDATQAPANSGAQDGAGTWKTADAAFSNWMSVAGTNGAFTANSNVIFGTNTAAAGAIAIDAGGVAVGNMTFNPASSNYYTFSGGTTTVAAGSWITTNDTTSSSGDIITGTRISSVIAGTAGATASAWTKAGAGRLIISGANTYTGITTVAQGILHIGGTGTSTALGSTSGGTVVNSGASLVIGDGTGNLTIAEAITIGGTGHVVSNGIGAIRNQSLDNTLSGAITLSSASQITSRAGGLTLSGVISGVFGLTITGEDTSSMVTTSGAANTYSGGTTINSGIYRLSKAAGVNAIVANQTVTINSSTGPRAILRLAQENQISDTGSLLNFVGSDNNTGAFQLFGFNETVAGIQSSGGAGIIENGSTAGTSIFALNNTVDNTYSGIIRNGGSGSATLNLVKTGAGKLALTGEASHASTLVMAGALELSGAGGRVTGASTITMAGGTTLRLTNIADAINNDRLGEGKITLASSILDYSHAADGNAYAEAAGILELGGGSNTVMTSQAGGGTSTLSFASLSRLGTATVNFTGTGLGAGAQNRILLDAAPATDHGMLGGWATVVNEFAKYGGNGITAMGDGDYETSAQGAGWTFNKNIKTTAGTILTADRNVNSLNLAQSASSTIDLGTRTLKLESGGLMVSGAYSSAINNGTLTAGTGAYNKGEVIVHQNGGGATTLTIGAAIRNNGSYAVGLTKSGAGKLLLTGTNTFTGGVAVNDGILQLGSAGAFSAGNDLTVNGGTFDLNGYSISAGAYSSYVASPGITTNTSGTAATLTIGSGDKSGSYYGSLQGNLAVTKTGTGTITLGGAGNYTGFTTVQSGGTLRIGSITSLGVANTAASGTRVQDGATLDLSDVPSTSGVYQEYLYVQGRGVDGQGALYKNSNGNWQSGNIGNMILEGNTTINGGGARFDFSTIQANGKSLTKLGNAQVTFNSATDLGNVYIKQFLVLFVGSMDLGLTTAGQNTITTNAGAQASFYEINHNDEKAFTLNGGALVRSGGGALTGFVGAVATNGPATITVTGGLKITAGNSEVRHSNSQIVFDLGAISRSKGATLNVSSTTGLQLASTGNAALATTTLGNTNGIIGGYLTYGGTAANAGGTTWAVNSLGTTVGSTTNVITGLTTFASNYAANGNVDVTASNVASAGTNFNVNTLRFNQAAATTLALTGTNNIVSSGGILVTSSSGAVSITGGADGTGTLKGSASGELFIHQHSGSAMTMSAIIADNTSATALVKGGTGLLTLTGNNTYTGGTYINGNVGSTLPGALRVTSISDTGDSNLGNSTNGSNGLFFNKGILDYQATVAATTGRNVTLYSGGGDFNIASASGSLELTGVVAGETLNVNGDSVNDALDDEGYYADQGTLTKTGTGVLILAGNTSNTYIGNTYISAGMLQLGKTNNATAINGNIILSSNNSILRWNESHQIKDTALINMSANSTLQLNGKTETIGGLVGTFAGSIVSDETGGGSLTVDVAAGKTHSFAGTLTGAFSFGKEGAGTQILAGSADYAGDTTVNGGTLQIGAGGSASWSGIGQVAIAQNAQVVVNSSSDLFVQHAITGQGSFTQAGTGTTYIDNPDGFQHTGGTTISAGRLVVNSTATVSGAGPVNITGGVLGGYGRVNGNTIVSGTGQINAGDAGSNRYSALSINGNLTLGRPENSAMARMVFEIGAGPTVHDLGLATAPNAAAYITQQGGSTYITSNYDVYVYAPLTGSETLTYGGEHDQIFINGSLTVEAGATIQVSNIAGYEFKAGDVFNLGDWTNLVVTNGSGVDRAWNPQLDMVLPQLADASLVWDTSLFAQYGIVFVATPEPGRAVLLMMGVMALVARRRRRIA